MLKLNDVLLFPVHVVRFCLDFIKKLFSSSKMEHQVLMLQDMLRLKSEVVDDFVNVHDDLLLKRLSDQAEIGRCHKQIEKMTYELDNEKFMMSVACEQRENTIAQRDELQTMNKELREENANLKESLDLWLNPVKVPTKKKSKSKKK